MTGRTDDEMVAYALEVDPALLPFVPELLADLDVLGADASLIVDALRRLGVSSSSTVVDLGCGKGGVAVAIAAEVGCHVIGVELFEPFVGIARAKADAAGLGDRCRFVHGGIADLVGAFPSADAVVFAALGDVLGPLDETMAIIRRYVRPGGHVVLNDSYLRDAQSARFPGFERYADLDGTRRGLTACGDELVLELLEPETDDDAVDGDDEMVLLDARARDLAVRHPHLAAAFDDFLRSQRDEYDYLDEHMVGAVWAVRRR